MKRYCSTTHPSINTHLANKKKKVWERWNQCYGGKAWKFSDCWVFCLQTHLLHTLRKGPQLNTPFSALLASWYVPRRGGRFICMLIQYNNFPTTFINDHWSSGPHHLWKPIVSIKPAQALTTPTGCVKWTAENSKDPSSQTANVIIDQVLGIK